MLFRRPPRRSGWRGEIDPREIVKDGGTTCHRRIFRLQVENIGIVNPPVPVATAVFDDDGNKTVAKRIERCRAHASRRRKSGDDDSIDTERLQFVGKFGSEKRAWIGLGDDAVAVERGQFGRKVGHRVALVEVSQGGNLPVKLVAGKARVGAIIFDAGKDHRNAGPPRRRTKTRRNRAFGIHISKQRSRRIEIGPRKIDEKEHRPHTRRDIAAETGSRIVAFEIVLWRRGHPGTIQGQVQFVYRIAMQNAPTAEIMEVSPRDGLQNESVHVSTADKLGLIGRLASFGARRIEVGSFVNPKRVPRMADTEAVIAGLPPRGERGFTATGLCLNERGVLRAIAGRADGVSGIDEAGCVLVATDTFGIRNQGQTVAEGLIANRAMIRLARAEGMRVQVTIAASFGCPFEGDVAPRHVVALAEQLVAFGAQEIALADTIGVAVPGQVGDLFTALIDRLGHAVPVRVHLHDTRGMGAANAWAAWQAGVRTFDASLGGLGGCPFAPGAAGNVATEELAYLFGRSGIGHNIDLAAALEANRWFAGVMGRTLPSRVGCAGDFIAETATERENA